MLLRCGPLATAPPSPSLCFPPSLLAPQITFKRGRLSETLPRCNAPFVTAVQAALAVVSETMRVGGELLTGLVIGLQSAPPQCLAGLGGGLGGLPSVPGLPGGIGGGLLLQNLQCAALLNCSGTMVPGKFFRPSVQVRAPTWLAGAAGQPTGHAARRSGCPPIPSATPLEELRRPAPPPCLESCMQFPAGFSTWPNEDIRYLAALFPRPQSSVLAGKLMVFRFTPPRAPVGNTPTTWPNAAFDVRYFSVCSYQNKLPLPLVINTDASGAQKQACLYNDQVTAACGARPGARRRWLRQPASPCCPRRLPHRGRPRPACLE